MKKSNFQHVGSAFDDFFKEKGFLKKMQEVAIKEAWHEIVGPVFSKSTQSISIHNSHMYVTILSPAIRNELMLNRSQIIKRINEKINSSVITQITIK